jgi:Zn-dependent peptidase ImmA (M78 family)
MERAVSLGCRVYFLPIPNTHYGYLATATDIVINSRLTHNHQREVLAHELGHVHYGHDLRLMHDSPADELRADQYAAQLLISPAEYALAEALHDGHGGGIAQELGLSTKMVKTWQDLMKGKMLV